jgi:hypothetical protein
MREVISDNGVFRTHIQYPAKVWERARARVKTLWSLAFILGDPKNAIFVGSQ